MELAPSQPPYLTVVGENTRRRWWIHLILVTGYILTVMVLGRFRTQANARMPALSHTAGGLLIVCAVELAAFGTVLAIAIKISRASRDDLLLRWHRSFWPVLQGIGYSVALRLALAVIAIAVLFILIATHVVTEKSVQGFAVTNRPRVEALVDVQAMSHDPLYFWLNVTVASFVVAGLREELWRSAFLAGLRSLWPKRFSSRAGQVGAVAIAAVVFGAAHLSMGWGAVLLAGLLGFGLGLIMTFHRSIWPAVIAHGAFDATSLALLPLVAEKLHLIQQTIGH